MSIDEQYKVQKAMNWLSMSYLVSNKEQLYFLKEDQKRILSELNGEGTSFIREQFLNLSNSIIDKLENKLLNTIKGISHISEICPLFFSLH